MNSKFLSHSFLLAIVFTSVAATGEDFPTGRFFAKRGPNDAPLQHVDLTKADGRFFLRLFVGNEWQEAGEVKSMKPESLKGALGMDPGLVNARGLDNGFVAIVLLNPHTKIRGTAISTGIVVISPFLGPSGAIELSKK